MKPSWLFVGSVSFQRSWATSNSLGFRIRHSATFQKHQNLGHFISLLKFQFWDEISDDFFKKISLLLWAAFWSSLLPRADLAAPLCRGHRGGLGQRGIALSGGTQTCPESQQQGSRRRRGAAGQELPLAEQTAEGVAEKSRGAKGRAQVQLTGSKTIHLLPCFRIIAPLRNILPVNFWTQLVLVHYLQMFLRIEYWQLRLRNHTFVYYTWSLQWGQERSWKAEGKNWQLPYIFLGHAQQSSSVLSLFPEISPPSLLAVGAPSWSGAGGGGGREKEEGALAEKTVTLPNDVQERQIIKIFL